MAGSRASGASARGTQVALLRGINVGKAKRVAMADLRALVEGLGFGAVRTLLNSGNVVFTATEKSAASSGARIEKALAAQVGVSARVLVIGASDLAAIVAGNPFGEIATDPSRFLVGFFADTGARARVEALGAEDWGRDRLAFGPHAAYLWCADGILKSRLLISAERAATRAGSTWTTRNWATILKLLALAGA